jgi:hypothetical protein
MSSIAVAYISKEKPAFATIDMHFMHLVQSDTDFHTAFAYRLDNAIL